MSTPLSLVADICLVSVSMAGFHTTRNLPFVAAGFSVFIARGVVSIVGYLVDGNNQQATELDSSIYIERLAFYLFAAHVMSNFMDPWEVTYTILVVPTLQLISEVDTKLERLSLSYTIGILFYIDFVKGKFHNVWLSVPLLFRNFLPKETPNSLIYCLCSIFSHMVYRGVLPIIDV